MQPGIAYTVLDPDRALAVKSIRIVFSTDWTHHTELHIRGFKSPVYASAQPSDYTTVLQYSSFSQETMSMISVNDVFHGFAIYVNPPTVWTLCRLIIFEPIGDEVETPDDCVSDGLMQNPYELVIDSNSPT